MNQGHQGICDVDNTYLEPVDNAPWAEQLALSRILRRPGEYVVLFGTHEYISQWGLEKVTIHGLEIWVDWGSSGRHFYSGPGGTHSCSRVDSYCQISGPGQRR